MSRPAKEPADLKKKKTDQFVKGRVVKCIQKSYNDQWVGRYFVICAVKGAKIQLLGREGTAFSTNLSSFDLKTNYKPTNIVVEGIS